MEENDNLTPGAQEMYVTAIGASAGGLEAIHEFFDNMPESDQLAYVVVQHLAPDYKSLLVDLVAKHTHMKVLEVQHNARIQAKNVYIIPPGKTIRVKNAHLQLENKPADKAPSNVIDQFMISLASEFENRAIAVILSGTGSDGTKGCEEIRNKGGLVLVQDPVTARFDGMPNSIINAGHLDYILAPELMPMQIFDFLKETIPPSEWDEDENQEQHLDKVLSLIFRNTGCDFQYYKRPTILRRIARRMAHYNIKKLDDYVNILEQDVEENKTLCKDFLIGVTKFFRDRQAFDAIARIVMPRWVAGNNNQEPFKIWVSGCSTGEEAYSLAMVVHHYFESNNLQNPIKIFASDIDQSAIEKASRGTYPLSIERDVDEHYLTRYFVREGDHYVIRQEIRKLLVFARHNIITDPPFIRNDIVSCRNMLIYMDIALQKKVLSTLYFSLNPGGYLLLGPSETATVLSENVEEIDRKWKLFRKRADGKPALGLYNHSIGGQSSYPRLVDRNTGLRPNTKNYEQVYQDILAEEFQFAGIYVDKNFIIKEAIGNYKNYLTLPSKNIQLNITKMVSPDVAIVLNSSLRKAAKSNERVKVEGIKTKVDGELKIYNLLVEPPKKETFGFFFIIFSQGIYEDRLHQYEALPLEEQSAQEINDYIAELKAELNETESNLQQAIENLENANQELQSTNEEMLSANEELQSSNEELQSLNEELHTLNTEHQAKISELVTLNDDLNNYFRNSDVGQVFLDGKMRIRKFNPVSTQMINLIESDIGRPLAHISTNLRDVNLDQEIRRVLEGTGKNELEVQLTDESISLLRITPYIKQDQTHDGVVLSFVDISDIKQLYGTLRATFNSTNNLVVAVKVIKNDAGKLEDLLATMYNEATAEIAGKTVEQFENFETFSLRLVFPDLFENDLRENFETVIKSGDPCSFEFNDSIHKAWFNVTAVGTSQGMVITFNNITGLKRAQTNLRRNVAELEKTRNDLEASNHDLQQFASVASHDLKEPLRKIQLNASILQKAIDSKLNKVEAAQFEAITKATVRMRSLIDDLLEFSQLSVEQSFEPININEIIAESIDDLDVLVKEKQAEIYIDRFPQIDGMGKKLRQLFQNLITNALKFSKSEESAKLQITCERTDEIRFDAEPVETGQYCLICVKDNGIGFDPQYAETIFEMFHRLKTNKSGTGIGLSICRKIVEQHHGRIRAVSKEGVGTSMEVILPIKQESEADHLEDTETMALASGINGRRKKIKN